MKNISKKSHIVSLCPFFWPHHTACGILVPRPGIKPGPQQWKRQVLTTGLPGNPSSRFLTAYERKEKREAGEEIDSITASIDVNLNKLQEVAKAREA